MGYASYTLPDGRAAGYGIEAKCDKDGCDEEIDRGLGYLCGEQPDGWRDSEEYGCGNYYCGPHQRDHDCPNQECGEYDVLEEACCARVAGHDGAHRDTDGEEFTATAGRNEP